MILLLKNYQLEDRVHSCFLSCLLLIHSHTIVRICPPQNATLEDIFVNKDKIDNALRSLSGVSIFSVEMVNPYAHHRQLLLGGGAGVQTTVPNEQGEKMVEIVPESSNFDESIIPDEKEDVEVVINNNQIEDVKCQEIESGVQQKKE